MSQKGRRKAVGIKTSAKDETFPFASGIEGKFVMYKGEFCKVVKMVPHGIEIVYKRRNRTIKDWEVQ